ncbi:MAG: ester cyclase [Solirubrobacteraceae bacterium]
MSAALADGFAAAWSGRDPAAFLTLCASDVHYEDPLCAAPLHGPMGIAGHARMLWDGFPDARMETAGEALAGGGGGGGRNLALPMRVSGTQTEPFAGLPASGRFLSVHGVFYCELDSSGERLWRVRGFFDAYRAGVELGVLPERGSVRERALLMLQGYGLRLGGG